MAGSLGMDRNGPLLTPSLRAPGGSPSRWPSSCTSGSSRHAQHRGLDRGMPHVCLSRRRRQTVCPCPCRVRTPRVSTDSRGLDPQPRSWQARLPLATVSNGAPGLDPAHLVGAYFTRPHYWDGHGPASSQRRGPVDPACGLQRTRGLPACTDSRESSARHLYTDGSDESVVFVPRLVDVPRRYHAVWPRPSGEAVETQRKQPMSHWHL